MRWAFSIFTCLACICKEEFHRSGHKEFLQESFELIKHAHALDRRGVQVIYYSSCNCSFIFTSVKEIR